VSLYGWDWARLQGSASAMRWTRRDLPNLDRIADQYCRERRVAVQAGGNLGLYPKRLAMSFATVYTFEPAPALFPMLVANAPEPNIVRLQAALGYHRTHVATVQERRDGKADAHEGITHVAGPGPIPVMRVDDMHLTACDLLQLDLEGWELFALQGADRTLTRCRPVVCVEINRSCAFVGVTPDQVRREVLDHGYRFADKFESDHVFVPEEWPA
jgi:FkbM family methyltransferase